MVLHIYKCILTRLLLLCICLGQLQRRRIEENSSGKGVKRRRKEEKGGGREESTLGACFFNVSCCVTGLQN